MTDITYSRAKTNDVEAFFSFFKSSIRDLFSEYTVMTREFFVEKDYTKSWMKKAIQKGDKILFIAKNNDEHAGYLFVNKIYGGVSMASWLAVSPKFQKLGIATQLVKMWEDYCLKHNAHALQLWTTNHNLEFYEKRGFVNAGTFNQGWFGVDMPLMCKSLRPADEKNYLHKYLASKAK